MRLSSGEQLFRFCKGSSFCTKIKQSIETLKQLTYFSSKGLPSLATSMFHVLLIRRFIVQKEELLTILHQKSGTDTSIHLIVIFGLWVVWLMKCVPCCHPFVLTVCRSCLQLSVGEITNFFHSSILKTYEPSSACVQSPTKNRDQRHLSY